MTAILNNIVPATTTATMTIGTANNIIRYFGEMRTNSVDTVLIYQLPKEGREVEMLLTAMEVICKELDTQFECINLVSLGCVGYANMFHESKSEMVYEAIKDSFMEYTKNIPEWAGISKSTIVSFVEVLASTEDYDYNTAMSAVLNGLTYSQRWGWGYDC